MQKDPEPDREIVSTRLFAAPREVVFRAFGDPRMLARWWGPKGFTNTFHEFNAASVRVLEKLGFERIAVQSGAFGNLLLLRLARDA